MKMKQINKEIRRFTLKRKLELLALSIFILLITALFNYLWSGVNQIEANYKEIMKISNVEEFRLLPEFEFEEYAEEIADDYSISADDLANLSPAELMDKYHISTADYERESIEALEDKYHFQSELYEEAILKEDKITYFITPYNGEIDKISYSEGERPESGEVAISLQYANSQNIKVGDVLSLDGKEYKVSGLTFSPLQLLLFSNEFSEDMFSRSNAGIIMSENDFRDLDVSRNHVYLAQFDESVEAKDHEIDRMQEDDLVASVSTPDQVPTLNTIQTDINTNYYLSLVSVITLFIITVFLIVIILNNQLAKLNHEFGIMLAIGIKKFQILNAFLVYSFIFVPSILLGTVLGIMMQGGIFAQFSAIYNLNFLLENNYVDSIIFGLSLAAFLVLLVIMLVLLKLRIPALALIKGDSKTKTSIFFKSLKKAFRWLPHKMQIKSSFAFYKVSYLLTMMMTILIVFNIFLIGFNLVSSNQNDFESYASNLNYSEYGVFETTETSDEENIGIQAAYELINVHSRQLENENLSVLGLKSDGTGFEQIHELLDDPDSIVITKKLAYQYDLDAGDTITLEIDHQPVEYTVSAINPLNFDSNNYVTIQSLWEHDPTFDSREFNIYFADNENDDLLDEADYTVSKTDEVNQVRTSLNQMSTLLTLLFIATSIISIVLLVLIGNLSVKENQKAIKILNLLGYSRFQTFQLSTDVYKIPIIIFSLIAMLISPYILSAFESLINDNESSIYIALENSPVTAMIVVVMLLVIYYLVFLFTYLIDTRKNK